MGPTKPSRGEQNIEGAENGDSERCYDGYGIGAYEGTVTITDSYLTVYGTSCGIATSDIIEPGTGGNIVINNSFVYASCAAEDCAAIYAGDNLPYGEGVHARIIPKLPPAKAGGLQNKFCASKTRHLG